MKGAGDGEHPDGEVTWRAFDPAVGTRSVEEIEQTSLRLSVVS